MDLKKMTKEDLETLSYADLAFFILKDNKKAMNTPAIFKKICSLLDFSDDEYASKVGDFYTSLTTDKRFVLLDSSEWDLRDNHSIKIVVDEEDEDIDEEDIIEQSDEEENIDADIENDIDSSIEVDIDEELDDDIDDDDMEDLEIVEEEELEEN